MAMEVNGYKIEPGVDLERANLRGANLRGANLRGANLTCANLSGTDYLIAGSPWLGAKPDSVVIDGADLSGANL